MSSHLPHVLRSSIAVVAIAITLGSVACGGGGAEVCVHDEDCASQFCRADGTCSPGDADAPAGDAGSGTDGGDASSAACIPDHDGTISATELPLIAGRSATFRVATDATIQTAGTANGDGSRAWDLSAQLSGDADETLALAAPAGAWWEQDFPSASYAVPLAAGSDLLGVFQVTTSGTSTTSGPGTLVLLGVVSPDQGSGTELTYDPPARILDVPFAAGDTWTSTSTVSGTASGILTAYTEKYASRVDEVGTLKTPYGTFPVVRIATDLTRTSGLATLAKNRTFSWNAECFGAVATVRSQDFESASEFTSAAEVRRLAP